MSNKRVTPAATWRELREFLKTCDEKQAFAALDAERAGEKRPTFMNAIYGRASILRADRERRELMR